MKSTVAIFTVVLGLTLLEVGHSQNPPAPKVDRVGFPEGYQTNFELLYVFDRPDNKSVRSVYGNAFAASVRFGGQANYPYGSIIVMETQRALQDAQGVPIVDEFGRFQKDPNGAVTIFVMRKEKGFGEEYKENRNGEWE